MLQLALGADGVELRPHVRGSAESLQFHFFLNLRFQNRWQREHACPGFSKSTQQGEIFKFSQDHRPNVF